MNGFLWMLVGIANFIVNILIGIVIRNYTLHQVRLGKTLKPILHKFQISEKVYYGGCVLFSIGISLIAYQINTYYHLSIYFLACIPFIYIIVQLIVSHLLFYKVQQQLLASETTMKEHLLFYLKMLGIMFVPAALFIIFRVYYIQHLGEADYLFYLVLVCGVSFYSFLYPYLILFVLRASPLEHQDVKATLQNFLQKQGLQHIPLYQFQMKKSKVANAMIVGIFTKKVLFSDYLLDHLTNEESKAILAHEVGHLKKHHLLMKAILTGMILPVFIGVGMLMDASEELFQFRIPIPIGVIFMLGGLLLYLGFVFLKLSKIHEYQADQYVMKSGLDMDVFKSALIKMAELNHQSTKSSNIGEILGTHPSVENRIKSLKAYKKDQQTSKKQLQSHHY